VLIASVDSESPIRAREKALLAIEVLGTYVSVRFRMRELDLVEAIARMRATDPVVERPVEEAVAARRTGIRLGHVVVKTLSVLPTDSRCLMRSLTLTRVLARRGIDTTLVIGVRTEPEFGAHAWIEHQGVPLLPALDVLDRRLVEV
jgi:hypothetical protein